jgi:protein-tyrosine phosphatase
MPNLVTLCTGNAARSVMAGAILAEHVPAIVVATRGTHVIEGMPMSWRTRDAIVALGAKADGQRSRQLAAADLAAADLVLAMAREHVEYVRRRYPEAGTRAKETWISSSPSSATLTNEFDGGSMS